MQTYEAHKNARLIYRLRSLGMGGAVLHIGAHPDDEDIGLLAYLTRKYGVRAVYWSATRGEGGQNRIGPYRDEALGIYRTWESLEAREIDGGECLFGPFYDFGYCKNAEEALAKWGQEALVREIVRAIRIVQPQVVVSRWTGNPEDLHGHHQAVGQAAIKAFEVAGDANYFSELKAHGLAAWTPLKHYHSTNNCNGDLRAGGTLNLVGCINPAHEKNGLLRINTGEFDPVSGRTYQELGWLAYNKHQTQAMGVAARPGNFFYYFRLHKSLVPVHAGETSLFDGLERTLVGLTSHPGNNCQLLRKHLQTVEEFAKSAFAEFRAEDPRRATEFLLRALALLRDTCADLPEEDLKSEAQEALMFYLTRKITEFEEVIGMCLGLELECLSDRPRIIPGQRFQVSVRLWNYHESQLGPAKFKMSLPKGWQAAPIELGPSVLEAGGDESEPVSLSGQTVFAITASDAAGFTCPYWLESPRSQYLYQLPDDKLGGLPFGPPPVSVGCEVDVRGHRFTLRKAPVCRQTFPGGFRELPLAVIPQVSLHPAAASQLLRFKDIDQHLGLQVLARNNSGGSVEGVLELVGPPEWDITPASLGLSFSEAGESRTVQHKVTVPSGTPPGRYEIEYRIKCGNQQYALVVSPVRMGAPGLSAVADESNCVKEEFILAPSRVTVHVIDVKIVENLRYAYIQGAEEDLRDALRKLGIEFHMIEDAEFGYLDFTEFDAVVVGPNAFLIRDELRKHASRLLEYVHNGGTLVVQYQGYLYESPGLAPYPFLYNQPHHRVTHEDAPVRILATKHLVFNFPNVICSSDFDGWIRDRGLYFFGTWDKRYTPLLSCSDPGEEPHGGGLIECQHGKGTFIYTGYTFFRQLPGGVTGAFRLFANILALPEARIRERIQFLRGISLFSLLTPEELDPIAKLMSEKWIEDGQYICRQTEVGQEMYVVYRGKVEVVRESDGSAEIIHVAGEGESLGEIAILGSIPRIASLRARGDVQLLVIKGAHFLSMLTRHPDMAVRVMKLLVQRLVPSA